MNKEKLHPNPPRKGGLKNRRRNEQIMKLDIASKSPLRGDLEGLYFITQL